MPYFICIVLFIFTLKKLLVTSRYYPSTNKYTVLLRKIQTELVLILEPTI